MMANITQSQVIGACVAALGALCMYFINDLNTQITEMQYRSVTKEELNVVVSRLEKTVETSISQVVDAKKTQFNMMQLWMDRIEDKQAVFAEDIKNILVKQREYDNADGS